MLADPSESSKSLLVALWSVYVQNGMFMVCFLEIGTR